MDRKDRPTLFLLVENDPTEVRLFSEILEDVAPRGKVRIESVCTVDEALARLRQPPVPDVVITDYGLRHSTGIDLIAQAKSDPALAAIPIILLTGVIDPEIFAKAYDFHANAVLQKVGTLEDSTALIGSIYRFWCEAVRLARPSKSFDDSHWRRG